MKEDRKPILLSKSSLIDELHEIGEDALAEAFRCVWQETGDPTSPRIYRTDDHDGIVGVCGLRELPDGTVTNDISVSWNDASERIGNGGDVAKAARRLLKRIFDGIPSLGIKVRMLLMLKGLDVEPKDRKYEHV
jgi:hypothetical protein